jgi:hypothetical protein
MGKSPIQISGKTIDGRLVLKGIFEFSSTTGLPLEMIIDQLTKQNMIIDWLDYYNKSIQSGIKKNRVIEKIRNAIGDVLGSSHGEETIKRLKEIMGQ